MTKVATANPNTKRYIDRDVFTYVAGLPPEQQDIENVRRIDSLLEYKTYYFHPGESMAFENYTITLDSILLGTRHEDYTPSPNDLAISASVKVVPKTDAIKGMLQDSASQAGQKSLVNTKVYEVNPTLIVRKGLLYGLTDQVNDLNIRMRLKTSTVDSLLPLDEKLAYEPLVIRQDQSLNWNGYTITMKGIDKKCRPSELCAGRKGHSSTGCI